MKIKAQQDEAYEPPILEDPTMTEEFQNDFPQDVETPLEAQEPAKEKPKKMETSKLIVLLCLINGFAWVWCSYILAWMDKVQIAESLSQVAVTEIIGVVLVYCLKSLFENLSKNNNWPDKHNNGNSGLG